MKNVENKDVKKEILNLTLGLYPLIEKNFHPFLKENFEEVKKLMESVALVNFDKKMHKASIYFVFKSAEYFNSKIHLVANEQICKKWDKIYNYLITEIADEVIEEEKKKEESRKNIEEAFENLLKENKFLAIWSTEMPINSEGKLDFNLPYPEKISVVDYDNESGWGHPNSVKIKENPTYLDVYIASNDVIKKSGDNAHIFIEGFRLSKCKTKLHLSTGS